MGFRVSANSWMEFATCVSDKLLLFDHMQLVLCACALLQTNLLVLFALQFTLSLTPKTALFFNCKCTMGLFYRSARDFFLHCREIIHRITRLYPSSCFCNKLNQRNQQLTNELSRYMFKLAIRIFTTLRK